MFFRYCCRFGGNGNESYVIKPNLIWRDFQKLSLNHLYLIPQHYPFGCVNFNFDKCHPLLFIIFPFKFCFVSVGLPTSSKIATAEVTREQHTTRTGPYMRHVHIREPLPRVCNRIERVTMMDGHKNAMLSLIESLLKISFIQNTKYKIKIGRPIRMCAIVCYCSGCSPYCCIHTYAPDGKKK